MKNLWRVVVLFLLPGVIGGMGSVIGFFRLSDSAFEPLKNLSVAAVVWCGTAVFAMYCAARMRRIWRLYYPAAALMLILFTCGIGLCRLAGWYGFGEGIAATVVSAFTWSWIFQSFCSPTYKPADRWYFIGGIVLGCGCCLHTLWGNYSAWLETRFFYLAELVLLFWVVASPLSLRGKTLSRNLWRWGMFTAAAGGVFLSPVLSFRPWNPPPEKYRDFLWQKTSITAQGSWFQWVGSQGKSVVSNAAGRLLLRDVNDEDLFAAMPTLVGVLNKENPSVLAVVPINSVLPDTLRKLSGADVATYSLPVSRFLTRYGLRIQTPVFLMGAPDIGNSRKYDLLLITSLPENQYPGAVSRFLKNMTAKLKDDAVIAVPAGLLKNQSVFSFMHEKFTYNGILPASGRLWIFSQKQMDLDSEKIERNFNAVSDCDLTLLEGVYGTVFSAEENGGFFPEPLPLENNLWVYNTNYGSWWYILLAGGVILLWRICRLAGERRNIMYSCWNSMENAFAAVIVFLLSLGGLTAECGCSSLLTAAAAVCMGAFLLAQWKIGGSAVLLCGLLAVFWLQGESALAHWFLLIVMAQSMFFCGSCAAGERPAVEKQKLACASAGGMFIASVVMMITWSYNLPLVLPGILAAAACVTGIWQNSVKRVY